MYKADTVRLVKIAQSIRKSFPNVKVQREWYICFDPEGKFLRVQETQPFNCDYKWPDILIFEKLENNKQGKLLCVIEIDGGKHFEKMLKTERRNDYYKDSNIILLPILDYKINQSGKIIQRPISETIQDTHKQLLTTLQNIKSCTVE